jgi:hypothetical protein
MIFVIAPTHRRHVRSPDGAKRNPGLVPPGETAPHCAALHAGYERIRLTNFRRQLAADLAQIA